MDEKDDTSGSVPTEYAAEMMKIDARALAMSGAKDVNNIDFVALKASEFLMIQSQLPMLDHNSMNSEAEKNLSTMADLVFKNIALSSKSRGSPMAEKRSPGK